MLDRSSEEVLSKTKADGEGFYQFVKQIIKEQNNPLIQAVYTNVNGICTPLMHPADSTLSIRHLRRTDEFPVDALQEREDNTVRPINVKWFIGYL